MTTGYTTVSVDLRHLDSVGDTGTLTVQLFQKVILSTGAVVYPQKETFAITAGVNAGITLPATDTSNPAEVPMLVSYQSADGKTTTLGQIVVPTSVSTVALATLLAVGTTSTTITPTSITVDVGGIVLVPSLAVLALTAAATLAGGQPQRCLVTDFGIYRDAVLGTNVVDGKRVVAQPGGARVWVQEVDGQVQRNTVSAREFGALGTTNLTTGAGPDDTVALQLALATLQGTGWTLFIPWGVYTTTAQLTATLPINIVGGASPVGLFTSMENNATTPHAQIRKKVSTGGDAVLALTGGNSTIEGVHCTAGPVGAPITYDMASVPSAPNNSLYGLYISGGKNNRVTRCAATQALTAGFYIAAGADINFFDTVMAWCCLTGIENHGTDSNWFNLYLHHNITDGFYNAGGNFQKITASRFEWNARHGLNLAGGEHIVVGNLFDRQGWAGLNLASNCWGGVCAGNYFSRNGAGGDGSYGRWGFSIPGHQSYVATAGAESCHIKFTFIRDWTFSGNRYHYNHGDGTGANTPANYGVTSPGFIYNNYGSSSTGIVIGANAGEQAGAGGTGGYDPTYFGGGDLCGGSNLYAGLFSHDYFPRTITAPAVASTAETILTLGCTEDAGASLKAFNVTSADGSFIPGWMWTATGTNFGAAYFNSVTDSGSNAIGVFDARIGASGDVNTRAMLFWWRMNGSVYMSLSRLGVLDVSAGPSPGITTSGNVSTMAVGKGLRIKQGTGGRAGSAILAAGTVTVANTNIVTGDLIFLAVSTPGGVQGILSYAVSTGASFTINSTNVADTSTVSWFIVGAS